MKASAVVRFKYRFCLAMRDPHAARRLTAKEFQRWMWYEQVEPFGELRADYRAAQIVSMIHNVAVTKKNQKEIQDFLLRFGGSPKKKQSVEEQVAMIRAMAEAFAKVDG